jgi:acetate kinase
MAHLSAYLSKLLVSVPLEDVRLVFAGGIGEHAAGLRGDVLGRFGWLGAAVGDGNAAPSGTVSVVSAPESKLKAYVVETDEEGWCAHLARERFGF